MRDKYPYLKDPLALTEINRHKWIESQKAGCEIGFATAATDWVKKHGEPWKKIHAKEHLYGEIFLERRKYRRFKLRGIVKFITDKTSINAEPQDMSFSGILCRTREHLSLGSTIKARMSLEFGHGAKNLECSGRIERVIVVDEKNYDLFFSFEDACQPRIEQALLS